MLRKRRVTDSHEEKKPNFRGIYVSKLRNEDKFNAQYKKYSVDVKCDCRRDRRD